MLSFLSYATRLLFYLFPAPSLLSSTTNTLESIQDYAQSLLASLPDPVSEEEDGTSADIESSPSSNDDSYHNGNRHQHGSNGAQTHNGKQRNIRRDELRRKESERERVEEVSLTGCREAVEILTRNPKKGQICFSFLFLPLFFVGCLLTLSINCFSFV